MQNFVQWYGSRTHYNVYVVIKMGQELQLLVYFPNGMVVFPIPFNNPLLLTIGISRFFLVEFECQLGTVLWGLR